MNDNQQSKNNTNFELAIMTTNFGQKFKLQIRTTHKAN